MLLFLAPRTIKGWRESGDEMGGGCGGTPMGKIVIEGLDTGEM